MDKAGGSTIMGAKHTLISLDSRYRLTMEIVVPGNFKIAVHIEDKINFDWFGSASWEELVTPLLPCPQPAMCSKPLINGRLRYFMDMPEYFAIDLRDATGWGIRIPFDSGEYMKCFLEIDKWQTQKNTR